ncbi:MAG: hypothetical protein IJ094_01720 [Bacilli bacterium]|nr:hypothetical protein [Bacilli bacterium]
MDKKKRDTRITFEQFLYCKILSHTINEDEEYHDTLELVGNSLDEKIKELITNPDKIDFKNLSDIEKYKIKKMDFNLYISLLQSMDEDDLSIREACQIYKLTDEMDFLRRFAFASLTKGWNPKEPNYVLELFKLYGYDLCMDNAPLRFYKYIFAQFHDADHEDVKKFVLEKQKNV